MFYSRKLRTGYYFNLTVVLEQATTVVSNCLAEREIKMGKEVNELPKVTQDNESKFSLQWISLHTEELCLWKPRVWSPLPKSMNFKTLLDSYE
jgi:hypothetical protein